MEYSNRYCAEVFSIMVVLSMLMITAVVINSCSADDPVLVGGHTSSSDGDVPTGYGMTSG